MKRVLLFTIISFCHLVAFSQVATEKISANNIETYLNTEGGLFYNENLSEGFNVKITQDFKASTLFAAWFLCSAENMNVDPTVFSPSSLGFVSGPVNKADFNFSFDRVWKVTRLEIEEHIAKFEQEGVVSNISQGILSWPANGNSFYSPALPIDQELAPFFDQNNNGLYEANLGDYPIVGEDLINVIPDELLFTIVNSNSTAMPPLENIEVHTSMYAFNCDSEENLNNTIFTRHKIINKNPFAYNDFRMALIQDHDIGCFIDDYLGCDSLLDMTFYYNSDPIDGDDQGLCMGGINTFGEFPPVHATVMLNQELKSFIYLNNMGVGSPDPITTNPSTATEYYNVMNGRFRDGTPLTVGGNGLNFGSADTTLFAFYDDPNDPNGWSMINETLFFNDQRTVLGTGVDQFATGEILVLDMAHIYTRDFDLGHIESVTTAKENITDIQLLYDERFTGSCALLSKSRDVELDQVSVFPNPVQDILFIDNVQRFSDYTIYTIYGELVSNGKLVDSSISIGAFMDSGVYILQLVDKTSGKASYAKFMVE